MTLWDSRFGQYQHQGKKKQANKWTIPTHQLISVCLISIFDFYSSCYPLCHTGLHIMSSLPLNMFQRVVDECKFLLTNFVLISKYACPWVKWMLCLLTWAVVAQISYYMYTLVPLTLQTHVEAVAKKPAKKDCRITSVTYIRNIPPCKRNTLYQGILEIQLATTNMHVIFYSAYPLKLGLTVISPRWPLLARTSLRSSTAALRAFKISSLIWRSTELSPGLSSVSGRVGQGFPLLTAGVTSAVEVQGPADPSSAAFSTSLASLVTTVDSVCPSDSADPCGPILNVSGSSFNFSPASCRRCFRHFKLQKRNTDQYLEYFF